MGFIDHAKGFGNAEMGRRAGPPYQQAVTRIFHRDGHDVDRDDNRWDLLIDRTRSDIDDAHVAIIRPRNRTEISERGVLL